MNTRTRITSSLIGFALATALVVVPAASASASTKCTDNVYGPGGYATCIGYIQTMLNSWAHDYGIAPIAVDNSYGPATTKRVKDFQYDQWNPKLTVDGYVGPKTWAALCGWSIYGTAAAKKARVLAGC
ncbi:peptidoglycan-binding protein [Agromyces sp. MMS24-JH15]|uniref:peptidoglycan-binding domain-containing protein n=1 Tax=Agromyces sp. MMS24-JH15 TaxID=3243765 RepID=UPI00374892B3